MKYFMPER